MSHASSTSKIQINCPHCGAGFRVSAEFVGKNVKCAKCSERFIIPAVAESTKPVLSKHEDTSASKDVDKNQNVKGKSFFAWYKRGIGKCHWGIQTVIWLLYGFLWIPCLWLLIRGRWKTSLVVAAFGIAIMFIAANGTIESWRPQAATDSSATPSSTGSSWSFGLGGKDPYAQIKADAKAEAEQLLPVAEQLVRDFEELKQETLAVQDQINELINDSFQKRNQRPTRLSSKYRLIRSDSFDAHNFAVQDEFWREAESFTHEQISLHEKLLKSIDHVGVAMKADPLRADFTRFKAFSEKTKRLFRELRKLR